MIIELQPVPDYEVDKGNDESGDEEGDDHFTCPFFRVAESFVCLLNAAPVEEH